jgi:predicted RNase H-like HicB family nuclease
VVAELRPTYTVLAEPSGPWWAITVAELRGVFSQARRLENVEHMARDAIALMLEVPSDSFDIDIRQVLDPEAEQAVAEAILARSKAAEQLRVAASKSREAVRVLDRRGLPQRDIGRILHLSHQRVAQLLASGRDG